MHAILLDIEMHVSGEEKLPWSLMKESIVPTAC
ncbi:MAG: hypothetical protein JWN04_4057 [Myxococcaceae bacterium]|nr:hypothetical protein [Myxococcaceae bacterium]